MRGGTAYVSPFTLLGVDSLLAAELGSELGKLTGPQDRPRRLSEGFAIEKIAR